MIENAMIDTGTLIRDCEFKRKTDYLQQRIIIG